MFLRRTLSVFILVGLAMGVGRNSSSEAPTSRATGALTPRASTQSQKSPLAPMAHKKARGYLERLDGTGVVQLRADGFEKLSLREKLLAYYLVRASEAGHRIIFDHNHRLSWPILDMLVQLQLHPTGISAPLMQRITHYTKLFWLHGGPYHTRNKAKLKITFTQQELQSAVDIARKHGAKIAPGVVAKVAKLLFDPAYQRLLKNMKPPKGQDILTSSGMNYYVDVTMQDIKKFSEQYALNSRLIKRGGKLLEEVFRAGKLPGIPPGRYHKELGRVVFFLRKALPYASPRQQETLKALIEHLQTGSLKAFDRMNILWLKDSPRIDLILGFIEQYIDPRGVKGAYEGIVSFVAPKQTRLMKAVAAKAQYYEDHSPWDARYKRKGIRVPVANAIHVLVGTGESGPFLPSGINLPNSDVIRQKHGSKSVLLLNVNLAINQVTLNSGLSEFALPKDQPAFKKHAAACWDAVVALHEVVGHGSGKTSPKVAGKPERFIKEYYSALEEARSDLVALHHMFDPMSYKIGLLRDQKVAEVCYRLYAMGDLLMLRRLANARTIKDDHMQAEHLIVSYAQRKHRAISRKVVGGKSYLVVDDIPKMRQAVAELLREVMRIKAEGDYAAAKRLFDTYGSHFDTTLRDEVVRRAKRVGVAQFHAFLNPQFKFVHSPQGKVIDVKVQYKETFTQQMLRYTRPVHHSTP